MRLRKLVLLPLALLLAQLGTAQTSTPTNRTIASGTEIKVRTDQKIPAKPARGTNFSATVSDDVMDSTGAVIVPRSTPATLVAVASDDGKDTVLDLRSVRLNNRSYLLTTSAPSQSTTPGGLGANKRPAKYVGGGAAVGALLLGLTSNFSAAYLPADYTYYSIIFTFVLVAIVLAVRPLGLFGRPE